MPASAPFYAFLFCSCLYLFFCCPHLFSQIVWFVYILALSSVLLPSFCRSLSVSLLSLSHNKKLQHTVMNPTFICLNAHCWPLLLFCAQKTPVYSSAPYHHCTTMLQALGTRIMVLMCSNGTINCSDDLGLP